VEEGLAMVKEHQCDLLIGCGGGSPLDVAKAVSMMAVNPGKIQDYMGIDKVASKGLPLFAAPTTAGTGSEATMFTIITDTERDVKMLIGSPYLLPDLAIVDPSLTLKMPKGLTAATGLDALTHAIEAYVSRKAQPMTDVLALSAVRLITRHLPVAFANPDNMEARANTMIGSLQAGIAFSNASVALVHGMSRPVGALFHVPHGVSNAALLGVVMEFSLSGNTKRYADIARAMEVECVPDADDQTVALAGAAKVKELIAELQVPNLTALGVSRDKLDPVVDKMAEDALASGSPGNNPRLASKEEIVELYYAAL
jgi:alcohol dehydrogenase